MKARGRCNDSSSPRPTYPISTSELVFWLCHVDVVPVGFVRVYTCSCTQIHRPTAILDQEMLSRWKGIEAKLFQAHAVQVRGTLRIGGSDELRIICARCLIVSTPCEHSATSDTRGNADKCGSAM